MDTNITQLVEEAAKVNPDLLLLPERWRTVPPREKFFEAIEQERGHSYHLLQDLAKKNDVYIITGGIWEEREDGK